MPEAVQAFVNNPDFRIVEKVLRSILTKAFAVEFPNIWKSLLSKNRITKETYDYVMNKMFDFIYKLYCQEVLHKSKHTFIIQNVAKSISVNYGWRGYQQIVLKARINQIKRKIQKMV